MQLNVLCVYGGAIEHVQNCRKKQLKLLSDNNEYWYCKCCKSIFPFIIVDDDEFAYLHTDIKCSEDYFNLYNNCKSIDFKDNLHSEYNVGDFEEDIDPNNNVFADIEKVCSYYTATEFNNKVKSSHNLSIIHFNCRSIKANFENMKRYLHALNVRFDVIAISETWLSDSDSVSEYFLDNYDNVCINRKNRRGCGVMIHISKFFEYKRVNDLYFAVDDFFEVITVELQIKNAKYVNVSCLYRAPGGCLEEFNNTLGVLINSFKGSKT